jgi:cellulose synthase (UDP-forming)
MKPGQDTRVSYQLTWQTTKNPWYFPYLLSLFFLLNMGYLGYLYAYAKDSGIFGLFVVLSQVYSISFSLIAFYCMRTVSSPVFEKPLQGKTVDVLIPTLNEDISVVGKTILGALAIRGVRRVLVLDDGNREELKHFVEKHHGVYLARLEHQHAKAGNLNFGLKYTDAEFLITLDADHVPEPEFIERTLGYFRDQKVAFVQTPQVFYNRDSFQHRERPDYSDWSEQTMFYESIQPTKNTHNAAFFCGSSAILRRSALDSVDGFATGTATEDIHTAIRLHSKKWKSVFINEKLAYGLAPDDLKEYYRQRVRWGAGSLGLLFRTKDSPFWCPGLTPMQRLCYVNSMLGFTQGEIKLLYYLLPVFTLLWIPDGVTPVFVVLPLSILYCLYSIWMVQIYSRKTYHYLFTEQYNTANIFSNFASLRGVIRIEKKFGVSIKAKKRRESIYVKKVLEWFVGFLVGIEGYGLLHAYYTYRGDMGELLYHNSGLALFWNLANIVIIGSFLSFVYQHSKKKMMNIRNIHVSPAAFSLATD